MTRKRKTLGCLALALAGLATAAFLGFFHPKETPVGDELQAFTTLDHPQMEEVSGLVASARHEDVLWAHNDSGNAPRLFAIDIDGEVIVPDQVEEPYEGIELPDATLVDWEAICLWGGRLYVTEMGNNFNARRHLGIYELEEPNPKRDLSAKVKRFIPVRYPDQKHFPARDHWHFDCEAAFALDGNLYFVTKNRPAFRLFVQQGSANLYRLSLEGLGEDNVLEAVDTVDGLEGWVTAADVSAGGHWVALLCESPVQSIWLFERPLEGDRFFSRAASVRRYVFHQGGQLESLAFAPTDQGEALFLVNEEREMFRLDLEKFVEVKR